MTSTTDTAPSAGSKLKDLVVTAAVASLVSAVVAPWIRRWLDGPMATAHGHPQLSSAPKPLTPPDDFNAHLERLLEVPNPFTDVRRMQTPEPAESPKGPRP